jgi:hypothetical protein
VLAVETAEDMKLELELSIRSRSRELKGRSSSAEWRLLRSSMDMLSVLCESEVRGWRRTVLELLPCRIFEMVVLNELLAGKPNLDEGGFTGGFGCEL